MSDIQISIAQSKKDLTKIVRDISNKEGNVIITRRGTPAAVLMPFDAYQRLKKMAVYAETIALRKRLVQSNVTSQKVYRESRGMLEKDR